MNGCSNKRTGLSEKNIFAWTSKSVVVECLSIYDFLAARSKSNLAADCWRIFAVSAVITEIEISIRTSPRLCYAKHHKNCCYVFYQRTQNFASRSTELLIEDYRQKHAVYLFKFICNFFNFYTQKHPLSCKPQTNFNWLCVITYFAEKVIYQ